jgi:hypothetical protein
MSATGHVTYRAKTCSKNSLKKIINKIFPSFFGNTYKEFPTKNGGDYLRYFPPRE